MMSWARHAVFALLFAVITAGAAGRSDSEATPSPPAGGATTEPAANTPAVSAEALTVASLQERLSQLGDAPGPQGDLLRKAIERLTRAVTLEGQTRELKQASQNAPSKLDAIRKELAEPPVDPVPDVDPNATLAELEKKEAEAAAALTAARSALAELQSETEKRQERRAAIPEQLASLRARLAELEDDAEPAPTEGADSGLANARRVSSLAQVREARAEIGLLEAELESYESRRELLPARRDRATRRVSTAEKLVTAWQGVVSTRRKAEAERALAEAERARKEAARQNPVLREFAAETQRLAEMRLSSDSPANQVTASGVQLSRVTTTFSDLKERYTSVTQRIEASGLSRATGLWLRREYETLPDSSALRRELQHSIRELEETEYALFELEQRLEGAYDTGRVADGLMEQIETDAADEEQKRAVATELARARADVLSSLRRDAETYQAVLADLTLETERLLKATRAYESFIRERIFWVRSISGERVPALDEFAQAFGLLFAPAGWGEAAVRVRDRLATRLPSTAIALAGLVALFAAGRWAKGERKRRAELVSRFRTDAFVHTMVVVGLTAVIAAPLPVLMLALAWVMVSPIEQNDAVLAIADGLRSAAYLLYALLFLRQAAASNGLAVTHFRWPLPALRSLRRGLGWFVPVLIPVVVLMLAVNWFDDESASGSVGRASFTAAMVLTAVFASWLLRLKGPVITAWTDAHPGAWASRLRFVWPMLAAVVPVFLAVLAWFGYAYTAEQLAVRTVVTLVLWAGLSLLNGMLLRWLFIARRRVAVEDARRRREQAEAEKAKGAVQSNAPSESTASAIDEDKLDLPAISLQTRQLFRTALAIGAVVGLFAIWADVLPALKILERVEVYPSIRLTETDGDETIPAFETTAAGRGSQTPPGSDAAANGSNGGTGEQTGQTRAASSEGKATNGASGTPVGGGIIPVPVDGGYDGGGPAVVVTAGDVAVAVIILLVTFVTFRNLPGLVEIMVLQRLPLDSGSRYALGTVLRYTIVIAGTAFAFGAVHVSWQNIQWLAAALTFGLAFGLQEIFANFISGLIILAERPIRIGDTVTVGTVSGTVSRIRMRATTITDWDRKELVIPNKSFITGDVINWTLSDPLMRIIIPIGVSYDADVRRAEDTLLRVAREQSLVLHEPKPYVVFQRFGESTLDLELRVFIPHVDHLISVKHAINMRITDCFREEGIEIAYPQRDLHVRSACELPLAGRDPKAEAGAAP